MEANGINKFWINRAEEILRSEIGQDELLKRREAQEKLFEVYEPIIIIINKSLSYCNIYISQLFCYYNV